MKGHRSTYVTLAAAALVAQALSSLAGSGARASDDPLADARAAVLRILGDQASPRGFEDLVHRPYAVCGWVHIRNATGPDGRRLFVYSLVSEQAYILGVPAGKPPSSGTLAAIRLYCGTTTT